MSRRLVGVGVGPGDPELITLKAARLIRGAAVVFHPSHGLARSIAAAHLDPSRQELVAVDFPLGDGATAAGGVAARLRDGLAAVFLTEGDPLLYSSFLTVAAALRRLDPGIELDVVPGVSSVTAAAARAGLGLGRGGERLAVLTGGDEDLEAALLRCDSVVVLKVGRGLGAALAALERTARTGEAVVVSRCGLPEEAVVTDVRTLAGRRLDYFSVLLVGRPW